MGEKKNIYETDEGWLNVELIVNEVVKYGFLVGNRSIGKTYGFLNYSINKSLDNIIDRYSLQSIEDFEKMPSMLDSEFQFFFLRRNLEQAKANARRLIQKAFLENFLASIDPLILELYETYTEFQGDAKGVRDILFVFRSKENKKDKKKIRIGYISAVSAAEKIRGPGIPEVKIIIFDEFQAKKNYQYLTNEPVEFDDIYDSIARERAGTGDCKAFALGNAGTILNPYFAYYDYDEFDQVKTEKRNGTVTFYHLENEANRSKAYNDSIAGTAYEKYSQKNQFADNDNFNVIRLKHAKNPRKILYNIMVDQTMLGVWQDGDKNLILSRVTDPSKRIIVDRVPKGKEILDLQIFYILADQLKNKYIYFDSPELRLIAEKYLRKYIYKDLSKVSGWESF